MCRVVKKRILVWRPAEGGLLGEEAFGGGVVGVGRLAVQGRYRVAVQGRRYPGAVQGRYRVAV